MHGHFDLQARTTVPREVEGIFPDRQANWDDAAGSLQLKPLPSNTPAGRRRHENRSQRSGQIVCKEAPALRLVLFVPERRSRETGIKGSRRERWHGIERRESSILKTPFWSNLYTAVAMKCNRHECAGVRAVHHSSVPVLIPLTNHSPDKSPKFLPSCFPYFPDSTPLHIPSEIVLHRIRF